jgi:hypothetical protein
MLKHKKWAVMAVIPVVAILTMVTGCTGDSPKGSAQATGQKLTETAFAKQQAAVPYPADQLTSSLERSNLRRRLLELNKPDKLGYVYIINFGKIIGYYAIKGKVSNTDSQMTTSTIVEHHGDNGGGGNITYPAPGDDGSYGVNETGNFFFTVEGVLVETDLNYLYADAPLPIDVPRLNAAKK